ncbi:MAG: fumarate hydratase [Desulfovibrio sp.]|jgi:fumarate hydratase subunit alpha|nr:fumarate hydratase [Desulfovibrio sp.]
MRTIPAAEVTRAVRALCLQANRHLPDDVRRALEQAALREENPHAREVLRQIRENCALAAATGLPLCQDTGLAVFFVTLGQEVRVDGDLTAAIQEGVRRGYADGFLRASVCHPFSRRNTGDNTPAVIHYDLAPGGGLRIVFMPKGGGAENMSRVTVITPAEGWEGIAAFTLRRVSEARSNPCPPVVIGLGVGGSLEQAALLAKKALLRPLDDLHPDPDLARKETALLERVNALGIGPMGLGGRTTCLGVKILAAPCHIASLPLAVNIQCHSSRHAEVEL